MEQYQRAEEMFRHYRYRYLKSDTADLCSRELEVGQLELDYPFSQVQDATVTMRMWR
jgi:hypothetical protein